MRRLGVGLGLIATAALGPATSPAYGYFDEDALLAFGARATGMRGAFTALADDVTAVGWNPAGLGHLTRFEVVAQAGRLRRPPDPWGMLSFRESVLQGFAAVGGPVLRFSTAVAALHSLEYRGYRNEVVGREDILRTAVASPPLWGVTAGAGARIGFGQHRYWISMMASRSFALDFGAMWRRQFGFALLREATVAWTYMNAFATARVFGSSMIFDPHQSFALAFAPDSSSQLTVEYVLFGNIRGFYRWRVRVGAERWLFRDHVALRAGVETAPSVGARWSGGVTVQAFASSLEYSASRVDGGYDEPAFDHRLQLTYRFGAGPEPNRASPLRARLDRHRPSR